MGNRMAAEQRGSGKSRSRPIRGGPAGGRGRKGRGVRRFDQILYHAWCKSCGICMAFCPVGIIARDPCGRPVITEAGKCIGCRFCELHCPDFAITIRERGESSGEGSDGV